MHMYRLEGTYRQIGLEYGALLRANRMPIPRVSAARLAFARQCEPHLREYAPELLEEIEGIAEGGEYEIERLKMMALGLDAHPACSMLAVTGQHTADGRPLVGRNHDWYFSSLGISVFCELRPLGAAASLGCSDGLVGHFDGINAAGVAVGITSVEGGRDHPGLMFTLATRIVLDRCRSTQEAVDFLLRIRHARAINFLVADSSGDIAMIEAAPARVHVIRPDNGFAAVTNQFQSDEMAHCEYVRRRPPTSYRRLCTLREWFAARQEPITPEDAQNVLSTPHPRGVCALLGGRSGKRGVGTLWSWTAAPGAGSLDLASGPPGETPYRTYHLD